PIPAAGYALGSVRRRAQPQVRQLHGPLRLRRHGGGGRVRSPDQGAAGRPAGSAGDGPDGSRAADPVRRSAAALCGRGSGCRGAAGACARRPAYCEAAVVNRAVDIRIAPQAEPAERDAFAAQLESWRARMESALAARLPDCDAVPTRLHQAMRYSVLGGGKRVRPMLLFASARTLGLAEAEVEAAACAVELVHVYSLVHDDLPAMDDDDLRRGRPTCHKAFDEATALLVGDALQPLAFQLLATDPKLPASPAIRLRLIDMLAQASGTLGMAGGQAIDLAVQGRRLDISQVEDMHARKTGAVIRASVLMAAECAPPLDPSLYGALSRFANAVGL